jgi:putative RecB family exonuclease
MPEEQLDRTGTLRFVEVPIFLRLRSKRPPLKLSPSGIAAFRRCPRLYKFIYIEKLGDRYRKPRPYFTMANHVHDTLRDFMTVVPVHRRTTETIEKLLRKNWKRYRVGFRGKEDELRWAEKALGQVRSFVAANDVAVTPFMVEASLESEITTGLILRGRIDRVDREEDGSLHIIDYKTGNMPELRDWTQLRMYALALSRRSPYPVRRLSYYYLGAGTVQSTRCGDGELDKARWELLTLAGRLLRERQYRSRPGIWCRDCDFKVICPRGDRSEEPSGADGQMDLWCDVWDDAKPA